MSGTMKALRLLAENKVALEEVPTPAAPQAGEVLVRVKAVSLNHLDLYGVRGMAFAKRQLPITVGVEGAGVVEAVGPGVPPERLGERVVIYPGLFCRECKWCRQGRENLCENVGGVMGFHVDGLACQLVRAPAHRLVQIPDKVSFADAACTTVTFATVQHMLFDNARLQASETILVHAGGSGIGSSAIRMAKAIGAEVFTTVGDDNKAEKARMLGADHVINYKSQRFEREVRRLTDKRGVDVVFEHVGPDTWAGSLLSMAKGGRLVTCGSTSGIVAETNLYQVFQMQLRIIGSFGSTMVNVRESLEKMAAGVCPVIDSEITLEEFPAALERLRARSVFGKIVAAIP